MDKFVEKVLNQKLQEDKLSLIEFNCIVNYIEKLIKKGAFNEQLQDEVDYYKHEYFSMCDLLDKTGAVCGDDRFEIMEKAKEDLLKKTNIDTSKDEMDVLDSFLFRCWQMGWLDKYKAKEIRKLNNG